MNDLNRSILFVDDEKQILSAIKRIFIGSNYNIFISDNGNDALEILKKEEIRLIISDMRMPGMDGYVLLKTVKEKYPSIIRIILSGYADMELIIRSLRHNLAKLYLFKPWDNKYLLSVIDNIFETEGVLMDKGLLYTINNIKELPTIGDTYNNLCSLISQNAELRKISKAIEKDPSVAVKVLHYSNSAFFGRKTGSIKQACMYLGLDNIKSIVFSTPTFGNRKYVNNLDSILDLLWQHSYLCEKLVSLLYEKTVKKKLPELYESSGLLHDIGKIVFLSYHPDKYPDIKGININQDEFLIDIEKEIFSAAHNEVGGHLLDWWELPFPVVESAFYYHDPMRGRVVNRELVAIVHLADYFSWELMGIKPFNSLDMSVFDYLHTTIDDCRKTITGFSDMAI